MDKAYIVGMHTKHDSDGKAVAYYYQLQTKLEFRKILLHNHSSETEQDLQINYRREKTHWLAYWKSSCPLIGIDNDDLQQNPVLVQFKISSTKYYERMSDPPLKNFRNINADIIENVWQSLVRDNFRMT